MRLEEEVVVVVVEGGGGGVVVVGSSCLRNIKRKHLYWVIINKNSSHYAADDRGANYRLYICPIT